MLWQCECVSECCLCDNINWNNINSLRLIWSLNYYTYCYLIVSTIKVIKIDLIHTLFFSSRNVQNQKQKNLRMDSLVCQRSSSCSSFDSHYYISLWKKGAYCFPFVGRPSVVQVHVYPFYYGHMGDIYVSQKFQLFFILIRWSTFFLIIVPNVELSPMCSPHFRPGMPGEQARVLSQFMLEVMKK